MYDPNYFEGSYAYGQQFPAPAEAPVHPYYHNEHYAYYNQSYYPNCYRFPPPSPQPSANNYDSNQTQNYNNFNSHRSLSDYGYQYRPWNNNNTWQHASNPNPRNINRNLSYVQMNNQPKSQELSQSVDKGSSCKQDSQYTCDPCDRSFKTQEAHQEHVNQHVKCGKQNCRFEAHEKVVKIHQKLQHNMRFTSQIVSLESPEDISKWINERKQRYPTLKVIEQKKAEQVEKEERREVLPSRSRKRRNRKPFFRRDRRNFLGQKHDQNSGQSTSTFMKSFEQNAENDEKDKNNSNIPMFLGMLHTLKMCEEEEEKEIVVQVVQEKSEVKEAKEQENNNDLCKFTDSEDEIATKEDNAKKLKFAGALGALIANYSETESEKESRQVSQQVTSDKSTQQNSYTKKANIHSKSAIMQHKKPSGKRNNDPGKKIPQRQLSLLEKLLENEMRHERNVLLQCVHHVVKNNFFDS